MRQLLFATLTVFVAMPSAANATKYLFAQPNASVAPAIMEITVAEHSVLVGGMAPGASVYLFNVAREARGYYTNVTDRDIILRDTDNDRWVSWEFPRLPMRSLWFAVDLQTGAYASSVGKDYRAKRIALMPKHLKVGRTEIEGLSYRGDRIYCLLIRPGVGIWGALVTLRGPGDTGTEDNYVTVVPPILLPRAGTTSPPPLTVKKGDVIILLNSYRGEYSIEAIGEVRR